MAKQSNRHTFGKGTKNPNQDPTRVTQRALPLKERMEILASIARDPAQKASDRNAAIKEMNDRHLGKSKEKIDLTTDNQPIGVALIPKILKEKEKKENAAG